MGLLAPEVSQTLAVSFVHRVLPKCWWLNPDHGPSQSFVERISAAAIANHAILEYLAYGMPLTVDNVILIVDDFFDPAKPEFGSLVRKIDDAIVYVVERNEDDPESRTGPQEGCPTFQLI